MPVPEYTTRIDVKAVSSIVWAAIVDPAKVAQYHLTGLKTIDLQNGGAIIYGDESEYMIVGRIIDFEPFRKLVHTFRFRPNHEGTMNDPETVVSYVLSEMPNGTMLELTHSGFLEENQTYANISGGWPFILEGLKAFVEREGIGQS